MKSIKERYKPNVTFLSVRFVDLNLNLPGIPEKYANGLTIVSGGTTEFGAMAQQSLSTDLLPFI